MSRFSLQEKLERLAIENGIKKVYFQPTSNIRMEYPCLVYERTNNVNQFANDKTYLRHQMYQILLITKDPDSIVPVKLANELRHGQYERSYISDNLYHYVITCFDTN